MLNNLSVLAKLISQGIINLVLLASVCGVAFWGLFGLSDMLARQSESAVLLRAQMTADMMHDGTKGNVLFALYTTTKAAIDPKDRDQAISKFQEDKATFEQSMASLEKGRLNDGTREILKAVQADVAAYLSSADSVISLAFRDHDAAANQLPEFMDHFAILEKSMARLGDAVEDEIMSTSAQGSKLSQGARMNMGFFALLGLLAMTILTGVLTRAISGPLRVAIANIKQIAIGDLTSDFGQKSLERRDEIGDLYRAMHQMSLDLRSGLGDVAQASASLDELSERLANQMQAAITAVGQIGASVRQVGEQAVNQSASATETHATLDEILRNLDDLNHLIGDQAASVTETSASIEQMIANIQAVTKNTDALGEAFNALETSSVEGQTQLKVAVDIIQQIARQSEKLIGANKVINAIAAQTNLLAMNATIEAAHAGDSGRGFAVVADEIRKLAEQSGIQSKEIAEDIKAIKKLIENAAVASNSTDLMFKVIMDRINTLGAFESEIKRAMTEQSSGSKQILDATTLINDITVKVRDSASEMLSGSQAIKTESQNLMEASLTLQTRVKQIAEGTEAIRESVEVVQGIGQTNRGLTRSLAGYIAKYKLSQG